MESTTHTSKLTGDKGPVKTILALLPVNPNTLLQIIAYKKLGEKIMPGISNARIQWKKNKLEVVDFLKSVNNQRVLVIDHSETFENTLQELKQIHNHPIVKVLKIDTEVKRIGFDPSFAAIFEKASKKLSTKTLTETMLALLERRWAAIQKCREDFIVGKKTTINPNNERTLLFCLESNGNNGLMSLATLMPKGLDILLQREFWQNEAGGKENETGLERKSISFSERATKYLPAIFEEIKKKGHAWHCSGNMICSYIEEPIGHINGTAKPFMVKDLYDIIISCVQIKDTVTVEKSPNVISISNAENSSEKQAQVA